MIRVWYVPALCLLILIGGGCAGHEKTILSPSNTDRPKTEQEVEQLHQWQKMYGIPVYCPICDAKNKQPVGTDDIK